MNLISVASFVCLVNLATIGPWSLGINRLFEKALASSLDEPSCHVSVCSGIIVLLAAWGHLSEIALELKVARVNFLVVPRNLISIAPVVVLVHSAVFGPWRDNHRLVHEEVACRCCVFKQNTLFNCIFWERRSFISNVANHRIVSWHELCGDCCDNKS